MKKVQCSNIEKGENVHTHYCRLYKFTLTEKYNPDLVYFCQRGEKSNEWKIYGITTDKNFPLIRF